VALADVELVTQVHQTVTVTPQAEELETQVAEAQVLPVAEMVQVLETSVQ
jgi:hypothetical protein